MEEETYYYNCKYCKKEFVPTKRGTQKYCKASCKTVDHRKRNKLKAQLALTEKTTSSIQTEVIVNEEVSIIKKEEVQSLAIPIEKSDKISEIEKKETKKMSFAGTAESTAGTLLADGLVSLFTKEENKPATKGDLIKAISHLDRYQPIFEMSRNSLGQLPYFDMETKTVLYMGVVNSLDFEKSLM